ncbi:MAG: glycosyltransferase family 39 protein [Lysobacter sp.]
MISKIFAHLMTRGFGSVGISSILLALALLTFLGVREFNGDPRYSRAVLADAAQLDGFVAAGGDGFRAVGSSGSHTISGKIRIRPGTRYVFSLASRPVDIGTTQIVVDLFGPGYDHAKQERSFAIYRSITPVRLSGGVDSGSDAPGEVEFRVMYTGQPGLIVQDIRISELSRWRVWLERLVSACTVLAFVWFLLAVARWSARTDPAATGPLVAGGRSVLPTLGMLFLGVSVARFVASMLLPYWSGDEYIYKAIAAGLWAGGRAGIPVSDQVLHETTLPNMLYPYVIAPAFAFGENFYSGIRLINALIISSSVFPAFFIARRFLGERASLLIALLSALLPSVMIAAYAVTETLYFPIFLCCALAGLRLLDRPDAWQRGVVLGVAVGTLLNVRLNGIVVLPAFFIALFAFAWRDPRRRTAASLLIPFVALIVAAIAYQLIKQSIAVPDTSGLGLYRNRSGGWVSTAINVAVADPAGVGKLLLGHLTLLALPFALGISAGLRVLTAKPQTEAADARWRDTAFISLLCLAAVSMAIVFTLGTAPIDLGGLGRWHSRYYFSVFPLILILCLAPREDFHFGATSRWIGWLAIAVLVGATVSFVFIFKYSADPWFGGTVDSMEAHWYRMSRAWLVLLLCITVAGAYWDERWRSKTAAVMTIGVWLVLSNVGAWRILHDASPGGDDPHCGELAYQVMFRDPGPVAVVASSRETLVDNVFWLPYLPETARMLNPQGELSARELGHVRYILADSAVVVKDAVLLSDTGVCRIYKVNGNEF